VASTVDVADRVASAGSARQGEAESLTTLLVDVEVVRPMVEGLTRGLDTLPPGPERTNECLVRRAEVMEGIGQVLHVVDVTEMALKRAREGTDPLAVGYITSDCLTDRLGWAAEMVGGLQRGVEALLHYDTYESANAWGPTANMPAVAQRAPALPASGGRVEDSSSASMADLNRLVMEELPPDRVEAYGRLGNLLGECEHRVMRLRANLLAMRQAAAEEEGRHLAKRASDQEQELSKAGGPGSFIDNMLQDAVCATVTHATLGFVRMAEPVARLFNESPERTKPPQQPPNITGSARVNVRTWTPQGVQSQAQNRSFPHHRPVPPLPTRSGPRDREYSGMFPSVPSGSVPSGSGVR